MKLFNVFMFLYVSSEVRRITKRFVVNTYFPLCYVNSFDMLLHASSRAELQTALTTGYLKIIDCKNFK